MFERCTTVISIHLRHCDNMMRSREKEAGYIGLEKRKTHENKNNKKSKKQYFGTLSIKEIPRTEAIVIRRVRMRGQ